MRWQLTARIQQVCAAVPGGPRLYRQIRRRPGRLDADLFRRLPRHAAMLRRLAGLGFDPAGARCLEAGAGQLPVAPVGFYLAGARETVTVDPHRRLDPRLTSAMLRSLAAAGDRVAELYDGLAPAAAIRDRLALIDALADRPYSLLDRIGVRHVAPGDAARLPDPDGSFDLSFSMSALEHVTPRALPDILAEAHRVLRPDGFAAHLIDPSDHFAHRDGGITRINFLRFSARDWVRLAGNEFAYCNRLRSPQFEHAFAAAGFRIERCDRTVDEPSRAALDQGFPVHDDFRAFDAAELCTTELEVYARPRLAVRAGAGRRG